MLEALGFRFLHPLAPSFPVSSTVDLEAAVAALKKGNGTVNAPRWPMRGWHVHTEHPLELCVRTPSHRTRSISLFPFQLLHYQLLLYCWRLLGHVVKL